MVVTIGASPLRTSAESCATVSDNRAVMIPTPPTTGNINTAASNPASTQCMARLATVGRDRGDGPDMPSSVGPSTVVDV